MLSYLLKYFNHDVMNTDWSCDQTGKTQLKDFLFCFLLWDVPQLKIVFFHVFNPKSTATFFLALSDEIQGGYVWREEGWWHSCVKGWSRKVKGCLAFGRPVLVSNKKAAAIMWYFSQRLHKSIKDQRKFIVIHILKEYKKYNAVSFY